MPPEYRAGSAREWLHHARSDFALAGIDPPAGVLLEDLCFHIQQAAEKALKAVLTARAIEFPKTHNIRTLLDLLPADIQKTDGIDDAAGLTDYAVLSRYPGDVEPVEMVEYQNALGIAGSVLKWASELIV